MSRDAWFVLLSIVWIAVLICVSLVMILGL
jgi:hypothetical protein